MGRQNLPVGYILQAGTFNKRLAEPSPSCRVPRALENTCKPVGSGPDAALTYGRGLLQVQFLDPIIVFHCVSLLQMICYRGPSLFTQANADIQPCIKYR